MKHSGMIGFILILTSSIGFAQTLRPCTTETMTCKLYDANQPYSNGAVDEATDKFSGLNWEEPSIPPESCSMTIALENKKGLTYLISLEDSDYKAQVFARNKTTMMMEEGSYKSFPIVAGTNFQYGFGSDLITCTMKK